MVFSSIPFLFVFLPIAMGLYFLVPMRAKNAVLLLVSLIFYAWGEPVYVLLMFYSIVLDYFAGRGIDKYRGRPAAKAFLMLSLIGNLGLLGFFKYGSFFMENLGL
ncbi:MAG: MBOAT family protein, partial [Christensenellaceae bacterium]|nr:MBOAT family protein [Christensenellaceae bacterium]